jgi:hypothetical protein
MDRSRNQSHSATGASRVLDRRSLLLSGLAAAGPWRRDIPLLEAAANSATPLIVRISLEGQSHEFQEARGRDLGDFVGRGFVQRCVLVTVPDLPLTVLMRPDRDSERVEVVFELGRLWSGPPRHLPGYAVEISRGDRVLANIEVPKHFWFARWRWQSAPRPVTASIRDWIASGLLPPYVTTGPKAAVPAAPSPAAPAPPDPSPTPVDDGPSLPSAQQVGEIHRAPNGQLVVDEATPQAPAAAPAPHPPKAPVRSAAPSSGYTIMGLAGLMPYMPTTGERNDIGPVTEIQGRWLITGSEDALHQLLAQAEASGTVPWHARDEKTGGPLDIERYPKAGWYGREQDDPFIPLLGSDATPDGAHQPALTYLPYLLTGDPYYLEALQFQMTWCLGQNPPPVRSGADGIMRHDQSREYAWTLRDLIQLTKLMPRSAPSWLLPQAYWERRLDNNRRWFEETFVRGPNPLFSVFRVATSFGGSRDDGPLKIGTYYAPWEEDMLAFILGWAVLMGFESWRPIFSWKIGSTIARTNGKSGWVRAHASPYRIVLRKSATDPIATSWADAWKINVELQKFSSADPDRWPEKDITYLGYARGALALAARLGIAGARDCFIWADEQARSHGQLPYKWLVAP